MSDDRQPPPIWLCLHGPPRLGEAGRGMALERKAAGALAWLALPLFVLADDAKKPDDKKPEEKKPEPITEKHFSVYDARGNP